MSSEQMALSAFADLDFEDERAERPRNKDGITFERLVENALDFFESALEALQDRPKNSVIDFYTGLELVLKARLMKEHWTLVVTKDPARTAFEKGNFQSVSFQEACVRLDKVVGSAIPNRTADAFDRIRQHRNRMVHFFHDASAKEIERIALEQLTAWIALIELVTTTWGEEFSDFTHRFADMERLLGHHRTFAEKFVETKWAEVQGRLETISEGGAQLIACSGCKKDAAQLVDDGLGHSTSSCIVCRRREVWNNVACKSCNAGAKIFPEYGFVCSNCDYDADEGEIVELLEQVGGHSRSDEDESGNCDNCQTQGSMIRFGDGYLCTSCLDPVGQLYRCEWCSELGTKYREHSYSSGCEHCEGAISWRRDE
jgi:hypothetical protein